VVGFFFLSFKNMISFLYVVCFLFYFHHCVVYDESYKTRPIIHIFWNIFYIVITYVVCIVATHILYSGNENNLSLTQNITCYIL
jgi:hypothetical protein